MSTMPVDSHVSLIDLADQTGADYVDRFISFMHDLGLIEPALVDGEIVMSPTKEFCRFFNLDSVGVSVEDGEWIRIG